MVALFVQFVYHCHFYILLNFMNAQIFYYLYVPFFWLVCAVFVKSAHFCSMFPAAQNVSHVQYQFYLHNITKWRPTGNCTLKWGETPSTYRLGAVPQKISWFVMLVSYFSLQALERARARERKRWKNSRFCWLPLCFFNRWWALLACSLVGYGMRRSKMAE